MSPIHRLSPEELERKFEECGMESVLKQCTPKPKPRDHKNPLKKKREYTLEFKMGDDLRAIICYFEDADGTERRSIRYMKCDDGQEFGAA